MVYILMIGIPVYLFMCADSTDTGVNGCVSRFCVITFPATIRRGLRVILGQTLFNGLESFCDYAANQRNPIMQIMYYVILNAAFGGWLVYGLPKLPTFLVSEFHSYFAPVFVIFAQYTYYLACSVGPGTITAENVECYNHQPYDGLMYVPGSYCTSCKVAKVGQCRCMGKYLILFYQDLFKMIIIDYTACAVQALQHLQDVRADL